MEEEWIVEVLGKEYGPVDEQTLDEWRRDGRLLPENRVRRSDRSDWVPASEIPGLFPVVDKPASVAGVALQRLPLNEIFLATATVYRKGFPCFFGLSLLVGIPSFALQLSSPSLEFFGTGAPISKGLVSSVFSFVMFFLWLAAWPIFIAGLQLATADLAAGRSVTLSDIFGRALGLWRRFARLSIFVYGSYLFWTGLPLLAIVALMSSGVSAIALLLSLLILGFQVYMAGRLFVNFMFWQQSAALAQLEGIEALRESKELARSRREVRWIDRPLWRGVIIASLWFLIVIALSVAAQFPIVLVHFRDVTSLEEVPAIMEKLAAARTPDAFMIAVYAVSSLVHAALRPLLGIAFVFLYFDAKADRADMPDSKATDLRTR